MRAAGSGRRGLDHVAYVPKPLVPFGAKGSEYTPPPAQIGASGTQWHVQVAVGHQYTGEVRVRVSSDVADLSGRRLVPVPVLTFTREAYVPLQSAGYAIKKGPAATVLS